MSFSGPVGEKAFLITSTQSFVFILLEVKDTIRDSTLVSRRLLLTIALRPLTLVSSPV